MTSFSFNCFGTKTQGERKRTITLRRKCNVCAAATLLCLWVVRTELIEAQMFRTIYNFSPGSHGMSHTNADGGQPQCTLFLSGNVLYGTASIDGPSLSGTVFRLNTDGSGFSTLHGFSAASDINPVNNDGANPHGGVTLSSNRLYGTAFYGGSGASGTVFGLDTNGDNFQTLYSFTPFGFTTNSDGAWPLADLVVSENVIYGSTFAGGLAGGGTVFRINTDGSGFATFDSLTNLAGSAPQGALALSGNVLYGTTPSGGGFSNGTVFRIDIDGTGLTALYSVPAHGNPGEGYHDNRGVSGPTVSR